MKPYRSVMADLLRERHRLREMLYLHPAKRDLIVRRLRELDTLISKHEDLGSRTYLEHIMNRARPAPGSGAHP